MKSRSGRNIKRSSLNEELEKLDAELQGLYLAVDDSLFSAERKMKVRCLETKQSIILKHKEETLHQKSRAIWLREGDCNSKYFHNYANHRRLSNSVWEIASD